METYDYVLTAEEVNLLIQIIDRTQFSKIQTAKAVVALADKLAAPMGGLRFTSEKQETPAPAEETETAEA